MLEGEFRLTPRERAELKDRMRSRTLPAEDVRRARLILLLAQGKSYLTIRQQLGCNPNYISSWKGRFEAGRLAGLYSRHRGWAVEKRTPALEPGFWNGRADMRRMAARTGAAASWPGTWASAVEQFLAAHPKVHLHYTPTYSSWLNQVENWFAR